MLKPFLFALGATGLIACTTTPISRVELVPLTSSQSLRANVSSAMVRTVSLPTYAAAEEVAIESPEGLITTNDTLLWADAPERAATLAITRHLNQILSATIGPDPWPFIDLPDVSIEVRVEDMLARNDGTFQLRGQYFIGGDAIDYRPIVRSFDYEIPLSVASPGGVATAQSQALLALSEDIAGSLSR